MSHSADAHKLTIPDIFVRIERIKETQKTDCEEAHKMEDQLRSDVLYRITQGGQAWFLSELARAALKTTEIDFPRWYA